MYKKQSLIFLVGLFFNFSLFANDSIVIKGVIKNSSRKYLEVKELSYAPEQSYKLYPIINDSFLLKFVTNKPVIIRIVNRDFVFDVKGSYFLKFNGYYGNIEADSLNDVFFKLQKNLDSLGGAYFINYEKDKTFDLYANLISKTVDSIQRHSFSKQSISFKKTILNYLNDRKLFLFSYPFVSGRVDNKTIDNFYSYWKSSTNLRLGNLGQYGLLGIYNFYLKGLYPKYKSVLRIKESKYWVSNDSLQKMILAKFTYENARNFIHIERGDLIYLQKSLCSIRDKDSTFCKYYQDKMSFSKLLYTDLIKNDTLLKMDDKSYSWANLQYSGKVAVYFWASWCSPCISFFKTLDMDKLAQIKNAEIYFISIDTDINAWEKRSKELQIPESLNYLLLNGRNSRFGKKIDLIEVPRFLYFKNNYYDQKVLKEEFFDLYKLDTKENTP